MKKFTHPRIQLAFSELCLGTASYGTSIAETAAFALLDRFTSLGGNAIDTANIYGKWGPEGIGTSEIIIGKWLKAHANRNKVILCTKGAHPELATMNIHRMTLADLRADLHESLENLGTDHVELFYLHRDAMEVPVGEIVDMLQQLMDEGLTQTVGVSNWTTERIRTAEEYARKKYGAEQFFAANQMMWNLAVSNKKEPAGAGTICMNANLFALHRTSSMAVFAYSSQARGLFTKAMRDDFGSNPAYDAIKADYLSEETKKRIQLVHDIARETGADGTQIALAWLLNQPFTTIPVIGCRTTAQLESSFSALNQSLRQVVNDKLNQTV